MRYNRPDYDKYMSSGEWAYRRRRAIQRAGGKCEKCPTKNELEAHHLTYKNFGDEKDEDLMVLCKRCHNDIHAYQGEIADDEIVKKQILITQENYNLRKEELCCR